MSHDFTGVPGAGMPYNGPERRRGDDRRKSDSERRVDIRFEPAKDPRRSGQDRRKNGWDKSPSR
jgi:hypothetical protein